MNIINRFKKISSDKAFIRKTLAITIPIALQGLLNNSLNFVDTLMIGKLGQSSLAAVGLANKVFFVFILLVFGINSGASILTSQYWGKRDITNIRKVLGVSIILSLFASFLFMIPSLLNPKLVMSIFTTGENTITIGATYLAIAAISYPFTALTNAYVSLLRGVNQVKTAVVISTIAIIVNVILNYVLIYGKGGFPELGVSGAAIATLIARIIECTSLLVIVYWKKGPAAAKWKELLGFNKRFIRKFYVTVSPVIANEFMWGLGVTMYSLVYGRMGDPSIAAITITQTGEQLMQVVFMSLSFATAVILGNEMGAGHLKDAEKHAEDLIFLQFMLTIVVAIVCFFARWPIIRIFEVTEEVAGYINLCFLVFIFYMPFKMFNTLNIVGILRSGGDTKASLFLDCSGVWLIGIPMAFLGGMVLHLPIYLVYAMVMVEEIYKFVLGYIRYRQKKWLRNMVSSD